MTSRHAIRAGTSRFRGHPPQEAENSGVLR